MLFSLQHIEFASPIWIRRLVPTISCLISCSISLTDARSLLKPTKWRFLCVCVGQKQQQSVARIQKKQTVHFTGAWLINLIKFTLSKFGFIYANCSSFLLFVSNKEQKDQVSSCCSCCCSRNTNNSNRLLFIMDTQSKTIIDPDLNDAKPPMLLTKSAQVASLVCRPRAATCYLPASGSRISQWNRLLQNSIVHVFHWRPSLIVVTRRK